MTRWRPLSERPREGELQLRALGTAPVVTPLDLPALVRGLAAERER